MPDAGCRMPDAGCRMPDAGCRMPDAGCRMPDVRCRAAGYWKSGRHPASLSGIWHLLMRYLALERSVNLRLLTFAEKECFHVLNKKLLMFGVDRAQPVMIDKLVLSREPRLPARLTNMLVHLFTQSAAKWRSLQSRQLLTTTTTLNYFGHFAPFCRLDLFPEFYRPQP